MIHSIYHSYYCGRALLVPSCRVLLFIACRLLPSKQK